MSKILITVEDLEFHAELTESPTAQKLWDSLPIEGVANIWGEEIYFAIPVSAQQEPDARQDVEVGTIAYWPAGEAFCIFFGPTPVSRGSTPRAYSPVNLLGKIEGDLSELKNVRQGAKVQLVKSGK